MYIVYSLNLVPRFVYTYNILLDHEYILNIVTYLLCLYSINVFNLLENIIYNYPRHTLFCYIINLLKPFCELCNNIN